MNLFTKAVWLKALEYGLVAGVTSLESSTVFTSGSLTLHGLEAAGIGAGTAALYAFIKVVSGLQALNSAKSAQAAK